MKLAIRQPVEYHFVPHEYKQEVIDSIFSHYKGAGTVRNIVCVEEDIVQSMKFLYMAILYFYDYKTVLDESVLYDPTEWDYLNDRYPFSETRSEFQLFQLDIKRILMENQMFFEENWVFSGIPGNYNYDYHNSPLQEVW